MTRDRLDELELERGQIVWACAVAAVSVTSGVM
jgi:hypothetical protein